MEVTYRMQDGFQIPNLLMPQEPEVHLGTTQSCAASI